MGITITSVQPHFQGSLSSSFERRENPGNDVGFSLNVVAHYMRYFLGVRETNRYFLLHCCTFLHLQMNNFDQQGSNSAQHNYALQLYHGCSTLIGKMT